MNAGEKILNEAEAMAESDEVRFRVQVAELPVWYVKIANERVTGETRTNLVKQFVAVAQKAGISNVSESTALAVWTKKQGVE